MIEDLTGKKFGKWTVLSFSRRTEKITLYNCKCECGTEREISAYKLIKGKTKSCGCSRTKDMTGKKIGMITFFEKVGMNENREVIYKCQCDCGNIVNKTRNDVIHHSKSCGCFKKESARNSMKINGEKLERVEGTCINNLNQKISKNNTSGVKGVHWDKTRKRWTAQIMFKHKNYYLGRYKDKDDAIKARQAAEKEIFGNFIEWYEKEYKQNKIHTGTK